MFTDFFIIFYWWLIILFIGLLFLPLTFSFFDRFWDKGWIFSKTIGIIITSYFLFVLARLHILPFFKETILLIVLLILIIDIWWLKKNKEPFLKKIRKNFKVFLIEEFIFFVALLLWSFVRGFQPDIEGLEKFMDFGFVNSILRSVWFPPADIWFAGESINYYYFGHLQTAVLTKLSGLDSVITYNLMIATIFALVFSSTFSLASNLVHLCRRKISGFFKKVSFKELVVAGLVSALLLSLGGNLHAIIYVLKEGKDNYWYPDATRFIGYRPDNPGDKTIHEFPVYSFVVADLHGHMNDIPTVLLFIAFLLTLSAGKKMFDLKKLGSLSFLLAVMYMTNSWDFPIYGILFAFFIFLIILNKEKGKLGERLLETIRKVLANGSLVLLGSIIFALPFAVSFSLVAEGIQFVMARSFWWQLLVLWGGFWFISFSFWALLLFRKKEKLKAPDLFVLAATIWATVLIIIPEIVYVKDIYIPEYHRANTMFKLVYQSFVIYSLASGYIFWRVKDYLKNKKLFLVITYVFAFILIFSAQMIYPYFAVKGYYGGLKEYQGIREGMGFLERAYPDSFEAVNWLKENVGGQPVVLEVAGDSYTLYNHISSMTGLPTIEGWLVHEWLWRGGYDQPGARSTEVEAIYQGDDDQHAEELLKHYRVKYVFVGGLEREKYPEVKEGRFAQLGRKVFSSGETRIYYLDRLEI